MAQKKGWEGDSQLVGKIYDAALDPHHWPEALEDLSWKTGSVVVNLIVQNFEEGRIDLFISFGGDQGRNGSYRDLLSRENPLLEPILEQSGTVYASHILLSEKEWTGSEFFQRGLKPYDLHYMAGLVAFRDDARIAQVECLRPKGKGRFSSRDLDTLRKFEPHFRRALQLNQKFWDTLSQHTAAIQILDTLTLGVILVDATCLPVYLNHYAEEILGEGTVIFLREQRLAATADHESQMLNDYLQGAASTGNGIGMSAGGIFTLGLEIESPLFLQIIPLRTERNNLGISNARVCAVVFLRQPDRPNALPLNALKDQFGLTTAEATFVQELDKGLTIDQIAKSGHISKHTARDHLKSIFRKTGTRRQAELVKLVLSSPTSFIRESEMLGVSLAGPLDKRQTSDRRLLERKDPA